MNENESQWESALVYALLFSAFGLFSLAIMAPKYESRQSVLEDEFRGIQEMQRRAGGAEASKQSRVEGGDANNSAPAADDARMISRRPLFLILGGVMIGTWVVLMFRRAKRRQILSSQAEKGTA